jgi:protein MpaA
VLAATPAAAPCDVLVGRSVRGAAICAQSLGDPSAARVALVVGSMHGDEPGGLAVVRSLRARRGSIRGVRIWVIDRVNPDGLARGTRVNARGVDLNRNFPEGWRPTGARGSRFYAGPRPSSEPETRAVRRFIARIRPDVSVWFHQPYGFVVLPARRSAPTEVQRRYSRAVGLRARRLGGPRLTGTAIAWSNARIGGTAFVAELRGGEVSAAVARRHAGAIVEVTRGQAGASTAATGLCPPSWILPGGCASTSSTPIASGTGPAAARRALASASASSSG